VARRRRRRERRDATEHRPAAPERREKRAVEKRRESFENEQRSLRRRRNVVGALMVLPLVGITVCGAGFLPACGIPTEWWLAIAAALFGSYLGITIRLFLERRRFLRGAASG
jgi:anti-sigma factor RsiW